MGYNITYSVGSMFAGIGGICIAFHDAGYDIRWANEIDKNACLTYRHNANIIGNTTIYEKDVRDFHPEKKDEVDVITAGFPCQPYSIAGQRKGADDPRGRDMFMQVVEKANACKARAIFLENVAQLMTISGGDVYKEYLKILNESGYCYHYERILNTKDYGGIAQFRNRLYAVVFRNSKDYELFKEKCDTELVTIDITRRYDDIISKEVDKKYYYNSNKMMRFNRDVKDIVTEDKVIYQYRRNTVRRNMSGLCPTLTASMGTGGHNVPLVFSGGVRKLTPEECLLYQGFPDNYEFPEIADSHKYKQIGNSVSVPVVRRIAQILKNSLEESDSD